MSQKNSEIRTSPTIPPSKPSVLESIMTGSVAGAVEVMVNHPLWTIKTRLQCGQSLTLQPSILYRGILPSAASMVPITALQVGLNQLFQNIIFPNVQELSNAEKVASAFVAGLGSSLVACPTEMVLVTQGRQQAPFFSVAKTLARRTGFQRLYTGLGATATREGLFTSFFLAGTPIIKSAIMSYHLSENTASLLAGTISGISATAASQSFDTIKTVQQDLKGQSPIKFNQAVKNIYSTEGVYGFFKGGLPRGARVASAVTVMSYVKDKMEKL